MPENFKSSPSKHGVGTSTFVAAKSAADTLIPANALKAADAALQSIDGEIAAKAHKAVAAVSSAVGVVQALQGDNVAGVIAASTPLAGIAVPELSALMGAASDATTLAQSFVTSPGLPAFATPPFVAATSLPALATPPFVPATLIPDEHPLGGQAVQDFIRKPEFYAPPMARLREAFDEERGVLEDKGRLLRLHAPLSGDKRLYASAMEGSSALSDLYCYRLQLLSRNAGIDLQEVMGNSFTVGIKLADGSEYPVNGYVTSFGFASTDGGLAVYSAELRPWLWYLGARINSRIFQDMSALDVLDVVFKDYGGLPDYQVRVTRRPGAETYIVQYDESDLNFVSRLLERYGLFYYFEHRADGHRLVISDDSADSAFCPPQTGHAVVRYNAGDHVDAQDTLTALAAYRNFQPSAVALNTFKYADPYAVQYVEQPTVAHQGEVPKLTVYHGNPAYAYPDKKAGSRDAQHLMEAYEWQAKLFMAQSQCRGMQAGHTFQLSGHHWFESEADADFLVVGTQINARNNFNLDGNSAGQADVYDNSLTMIRRKVPYRPVRHHAKPAMKGPQTATVVGPAGQEIHTDKLGRIKVQFPWDLEGKHDQSSSCWIRVSQPWAGRGWGTVSIPRIGQEVLIDYIEGDPDRPVCTGRLFNAQQTMPFDGPDGGTVMGFISNSTPGGGGQCRMTIRDTAGKELIDLYSQKDMNITVLDAETHVVDKGNRSVTLKTGDESKTLAQGGLSETIAKMRSTDANTVQVKTKGKTDSPGTQLYEASDQIKHAVGAGSVTMTKEMIKLEFGPSSIVISKKGIFIDGPVVHLNKEKS
ncbi:type VI secretion system tip protein TssI/VgrG [Stenotrophomonas sp.]|uniref:type VI secretion system Vgr family protein n=1 Tax=Stenotrophomonas sp. TaxID=69392 RepID=UPI0028A6864C|nr:type VI secretion system tip protein TssI/VgrG [Stenotrophomonas sp.]